MDVQQSVLPGGLRVLTSHMPGFCSAAVVVYVKAGARYESAANGGTAHFLEHLAFKGTRRRTALQIATEIECLGANVNAFTSKEVTAYYVSGLQRSVPDAVAILGDVLTESVFAAEDVALERKVVLQEINRAQDNPGHVAHQDLMAAAFPDQALGRPILGAADFISQITRDDVADFVRRHYFAGNMVVVGAGDIQHAAFCDLVAEHFAGLPTAGAAEIPSPARYVGGFRRTDSSRFQQVTVLLGLPSVPDGDRRAHAHSFLGGALGSGLSSPLFQEVRQKRGLAYSVHASGERGSDFGVLNVYAGTSAEHVEEALTVICAELLRATDKIGELDLQRARNSALARLATVTENPFRVARTIGWGLFTHNRVITPTELMAEAEAVTEDDVKEAAQLVVSGKPVLSLTGPAEDRDYYGLVEAALAG